MGKHLKKADLHAKCLADPECSSKLFSPLQLFGAQAFAGGGCLNQGADGVYALGAKETCTVGSISVSQKLLPVVIKNNLGIAANTDVYVIVKGSLFGPTQDVQCLVQFDTEGQGHCVSVTGTTNIASYSYKLSSFPTNPDTVTGGVKFYLPQMISARMYFSVKSALRIRIDTSNPSHPTILDPNGFDTRDTNYYTIYDKIEFTFNDIGVFANPTAVDFFSLPITLNWEGQTSGFSSSRSSILNSVTTLFTTESSSKSPSTYSEWSKIFLSYTGLDYSGGSSTSTLRVVAPGKAMVNTGAISNPVFANDYLSNAATFGFDYINAIWLYYSQPGKMLKIDCSELANDPAFSPKLADYNFKGTVVGYSSTGGTLVFTNDAQTATVSIGRPQSISFFAGAQGTFEYPNHTAGALIVRSLSAAFDAGLLPAPDGAILSKNYFISIHNSFYQANSLLGAGNTGPWYDLYSKALHSISASQHIYTFAYDDVLGQDGTLSTANTNNAILNIDLQDCTGTAIPDPFTDPATYNVFINIGNNTNRWHNVQYAGQTLIPSSIPANFPAATIPLNVNIDSTNYQIYLLHTMVLPGDILGNGIVVTHQSGNQYTINIPAP